MIVIIYVYLNPFPNREDVKLALAFITTYIYDYLRLQIRRNHVFHVTRKVNVIRWHHKCLRKQMHLSTNRRS